MDNRRASDATLTEMAVDIKYIKEAMVTHSVEINKLKEWKLKWEGFKWAWALIFTAIGAGIQVLVEWFLGKNYG